MMSLSAILIQLVNGLADASSLFLVAAGLSLIFGVTRIVNFAHGSFYMLGAYIAYSLVRPSAARIVGFWFGVLAAALVVGVLGALVEMMLLRRIYRAPELFQLLATFALVLIVRDIALWLWGPEDLCGPRAPHLGGAVHRSASRCPPTIYSLIVIGPLVLCCSGAAHAHALGHAGARGTAGPRDGAAHSASIRRGCLPACLRRCVSGGPRRRDCRCHASRPIWPWIWRPSVTTFRGRGGRRHGQPYRARSSPRC